MNSFRKSRILYLNHTGHVSGAEKVLIDILRGLDREQYEPIVLCPADGTLAAISQQAGSEWIPLPAIDARFAWRPDRVVRSLVHFSKMVFYVRRQLRMLAPNLIHANSVRAGLAASLAAIGFPTPVIWHVHDTLPKHPLSTAIRVIAYLAPRATMIAVSQSTSLHFQGLVPFGSKIRTIYNGVDLSRFPVKQSGCSVFREGLGLSEQDFLVCAVGQICARKGLLQLIEALRIIHPQVPRMHLAIVGKVVFRHEEEYMKALRVAAAAPGIAEFVHFTGELGEVSLAIQAADLLVLNSTDEPFGLVLIEAMSSGTPTLATRVGGIPEIITDSENGWLVAKGDTTALASKLVTLSRDRNGLAQCANRARRITCPKFSLQRFQSDLFSFYAELNSNSGLQWSPRNGEAFAQNENG